MDQILQGMVFQSTVVPGKSGCHQWNVILLNGLVPSSEHSATLKETFATLLQAIKYQWLSEKINPVETLMLFASLSNLGSYDMFVVVVLEKHIDCFSSKMSSR